MRALDELGYEEPSAIQAQSIPAVMAGHDLVGQAQTGTGKTAAFTLPLLHHLDLNVSQCQALVLTPTRELAIQVAEAIETYGKHIKGLRVTCLYGGSSMVNQIKELKRGAHIVVGTPGRTLDHIRRKTLRLNSAKSFVLDEADEMLRMGFIEDVERILDATPDDRQVLLFSATMPNAIRRIAQKYLVEPREVSIERKTATVSTITQKYWTVERGINKLSALSRILAMQEHDGVIVFVRTRRDTELVGEALMERGISVSKLHGGIDQSTRQETVEQFRKGVMDVLVTTDVAARGLDVERITHVVNFDPPHDSETYVHRIGRTGRAGREGTSILFLYAKERRWLKQLERDIRQPLEAMQLPTERELEGRRIEHFKSQVHETHVDDVQEIYARVIHDLCEEKGMSHLECAAALLKMVTAPMGLVEPAGLPGPPTVQVQSSTHQNDEDGDSRRDRSDRKERAARVSAPDEDMDLYRIELTRTDGVTPRRIVGALTNEVGLPRAAIGRIEFYQEYTTVELARGLPQELVEDLTELEVAHLPIGMHLMLQPPTGKPLPSRSGGAQGKGGWRSDRNGGKKKPHRGGGAKKGKGSPGFKGRSKSKGFKKKR